MAIADEKDVEEGLLSSELASEPKPVAAADARRVLGLPVHIVSGAAYCVASASMVLLNKAALSSFDFNSTTSLLFFQCLVCVILVKTADLFGLVSLEPWNMKIIQVCSCSLYEAVVELENEHHQDNLSPAGLVSSKPDICWHDMDKLFCSQEPWCSHGNCAEEPHKLVCDRRGLLLLQQNIWPRCLDDVGPYDAVSSMWSSNRSGIQCRWLFLATDQLHVHSSILSVLTWRHGQAGGPDCQQNQAG